MALLVCLIPTTIGGLLSAIGIAGMDRLIRKNVIPMSGRAVEAAGDVDTMLLDKTGTITLGNRDGDASSCPCPASRMEELADAAQLASLADETPEGRSIVVLVKERYGCAARRDRRRAREVRALHRADAHERLRPRRPRASARARSTRSSSTRARRAARVPAELHHAGGAHRRQPAARRSRSADGPRVLGVVHLKDIVKGGIKERFARFRAMGIRTVMITGRQPAHRRGDRGARRASTTSSPRPRPR